ncbi:MAG: hypothetical protein A2934_00620 [Candidatus Sungbacteria bacterium RIFCSPLOWO2_01_FULL_47_10]|uniref:Poly-beta-1,6-N-acetyl-D-glucosamine biosynthesis protein PgaD n=1 Tax=Candidatus Sungbacteria bacterium RIFCSPLOWO2_01_FULL_47_10 TaxID=1802276 RepID=A0A1G2L5K3_9BACT|nr:MAG: hypothetical protein A2934_00620 [Candidatus Sungbacteria bacterium RIFCSPLOWO2_01_FULL_47_10]
MFWNRIHKFFDVLHTLVFVGWVGYLLYSLIFSHPGLRQLFQEPAGSVFVSVFIILAFYGILAVVGIALLIWFFNPVHALLEDMALRREGYSIQCKFMHGGTVGEYPASGGWERLIPEKIEPIPTPKPKPRKEENL